jgi:hypothetical protein
MLADRSGEVRAALDDEPEALATVLSMFEPGAVVVDDLGLAVGHRARQQTTYPRSRDMGYRYQRLPVRRRRCG